MPEQRWNVTSLTWYYPASRNRTLFFRKEGHMKRGMALLLVVVLCSTVGCANMTPQQQRALSGGAIGAAGGAAVGAIVGGSPAIGAAVGGAAGVAAGALWDDINRALK
jgi:osmotically inducible lipoprotein OsmB